MVTVVTGLALLVVMVAVVVRASGDYGFISGNGDGLVT